jgi:hypothetical protein
MKWFKHDTDGHRGETCSWIKSHYGRDWVDRWFEILEIIAERMDETDKTSLSLPVSEWSKRLDCTPDKLVRFLEELSEACSACVVGTASAPRTHRQRNTMTLTIDIPNLLIKRDNHTRNLQVTCKQEKEKEKKKKKEILKEKEGTPDPVVKNAPVIAPPRFHNHNPDRGVVKSAADLLSGLNNGKEIQKPKGPISELTESLVKTLNAMPGDAPEITAKETAELRRLITRAVGNRGQPAIEGWIASLKLDPSTIRESRFKLGCWKLNPLAKTERASP